MDFQLFNAASLIQSAKTTNANFRSIKDLNFDSFLQINCNLASPYVI